MSGAGATWRRRAAETAVAAFLALALGSARAEEARPETAVAQPAAAEPGGEYPENGLLFYPAGPGEGKERWAVGGLWQIAPMFTADYSRGLGSGFSVDARLQTIVLYNQLGVGARWATSWGPFSLGLMAHVDGFVGVLGKAFVATTSFDTIGWGILTKPGAFAGLKVARDSWLTLEYEAYFSPYQATKLGDLVISPESRLYEGEGLSLVVEHVPWRKGAIYYGATLYHTRTNYPMLFNVEASSTSDAFSTRMIWYIGLLAGYEF